MRLRHFLLMNAVDATATTGGAPAPAPAASPSPSPAPAPAEESLLPPLGASPAPAPAADGTTVDHAWLPEKFRVNGADGKLDLAASSQKLGESYGNLERMKGATPPATPDDYTFTPPEGMGDLKFDDALSAGFRERAHKAGLSAEQYQFIMGEYVDLVPQMLDAAANVSAAEARAELSKVWQSQAVFDQQLNNAGAAISAAPEHLRADLHSRFGRDPAFLQFAAWMGAQMQEDRPPQNPDGGSGGDSVERLMASDAYRDAKHPDHAAVSKRVMTALQRANPG